MLLLTTFLFVTVLDFNQATYLSNVNPRPLLPRPSGPVRRQVSLLGPGLMLRFTPETSPRLHPSKSAVWVKKFDPRTGAWVKVISAKRDVINPAVRHHFAKKAHIARKMRIMNNIFRARNLARLNTVTGGSLGFARERDEDETLRVSAGVLGQHRRGNYRRYSVKPKHLIQTHPRAGTSGILGQTFVRRPGPVNFLSNNRARLMGSSRIGDDGDFLDDFVDNTLDNNPNYLNNFRQIDNSFDDRFDRGFRDTYPLLNTGSSSVRAGVRGFQRSLPQKPTQILNRKMRIPSIRAGLLGFPQKGYYSGKSGTPIQNINTVGIGGTQTGTFKSLDGLGNSVSAAILGTFGRNRNNQFKGMRGRPAGFAGILGNQQTADGTIPRMLKKAMAINDRISESSIVTSPNPSGNIGTTTTGVVGLAGVERFPDGFLGGDMDNLDDLSDTFDSRLDLVSDELSHLNDRLDLNHRLNINGRINLNEKLNDLNNKLERRLLPGAPIKTGIDEEILDRPHIVTAIRDRDDRESGGDIGLLGQDQSPIDGLELLGPSTWSDIITELQHAASHKDIFDQIPQESVPVFPVNPHTPAEPSSTVEGGVVTERTNGLEEGSLALLGIDPATITTEAEHPPPIPLPNKFQNAMKQTPLGSQAQSNKITVTGSDDSTQTVITVESSNNGNPLSSRLSSVDQTIHAPTKDIVNAAREMAVLGALDNLDIGLDSFDGNLKV